LHSARWHVLEVEVYQAVPHWRHYLNLVNASPGIPPVSKMFIRCDISDYELGLIAEKAEQSEEEGAAIAHDDKSKKMMRVLLIHVVHGITID
jgi:hypothetical protein